MFIKKVGRTALDYTTAVERMIVMLGDLAENVIQRNGYSKTFVVYKPPYGCLPVDMRQRLRLTQEEYEMYTT
jgi:hypothetical protein